MTTTPTTGTPRRGSADTARRMRPSGMRWSPSGRRRQPILALVGLLLTLVGGIVAAVLFQQAGDRVPVLVMTRTVQVGQPVTDADLAEHRVAVDPAVQSIPAADRAQVVGQTATATLPAGMLLTRAHLVDQPVPGPGLAAVGVLVQPGQMPAGGLTPGDLVQVVAAQAAGQPATGGGPALGTVLVDQARVFESQPSQTTEAAVVTVIVRQGDAPRVARLGAGGQVALIRLPAAEPQQGGEGGSG